MCEVVRTEEKKKLNKVCLFYDATALVFIAYETYLHSFALGAFLLAGVHDEGQEPTLTVTRFSLSETCFG